MLDTQPRPSLLAGVPILSAGVDWLTATVHEGGRQPHLEEVARWWAEQAQQAGARVASWRWNGYEGYRCGGVAYGRRPDGTIVRLSGADAAIAWREVAPLADNISRLDLQVTIDGGPGCIGLTEVHEWEALNAVRGRGRPPDIDNRSKNGVSQTLNIGSRESKLYGRIYDKRAESPDDWPVGAWRYEVEAKAEQALALAGELASTRQNVARSIAYVHGWFLARGVEPMFTPTTSAPEVRLERSRSDIERVEKWFRHQVGPTFAKYAIDGHGPRLLRAMLHYLNDVAAGDSGAQGEESEGVYRLGGADTRQAVKGGEAIGAADAALDGRTPTDPS